MLAKRIPTIMPELSYEESMELTKIYSVAGKLDKNTPLITNRPFRNPHHNITSAGLLGGGRIPKPGEITLAGKGVLFLDEMTEFGISVIESLRQPLEDKKVTIVRLNSSFTYPADCMLAAAINVAEVLSIQCKSRVFTIKTVEMACLLEYWISKGYSDNFSDMTYLRQFL